MIRKFLKTSWIHFFKFVAVSGASAVCNLIMRYLLNFCFSFSVSIVIAYVISTSIAFVLNKIFVFKLNENSFKAQVIRFIIVNIFGMLQTLAVSLLLKDYIFVKAGFEFYPAEAAHFLGLGSTAVTSYFGHKFYTFGKMPKV